MVRISVRDHGDGIPAEFRPRIFEKFAQADATDARQKSGTGLGLSIVREIVARLGGKVGFEDAKGGGTAFYVELPGWTQIARREFDAERTADAVRILFCEDDPDAAFALRQGLRPFGFSTDFAHSPADAIAHVRTNQYAVILIDFELPHADGVNFIRRLREQPETYKTPIVIVSGDPGRTGGEADKFNVLAWIAKPIDLHPLAELLDSAARGAHGRPCILHVDDASDVLDLVARALQATARVVSVASIEAARQALLANRFDLVVLDIAVGEVSGLDLLPYLRSRNGTPIPVIIFSAHAAELSANPQVEARLNKSRASLEDLVAAVHDRLTLKSVQSVEEFP
jgi:CheY-like chemotaxis protein